MTGTFRVLVTGSRDLQQPGMVSMALEILWSEIRHTHERMVVVQGNCPTGPDSDAKSWALGHEDGDRVSEEGYDAHWHLYGPSAGPERNKLMVSKGADRCLAFIGPCTSKRCRKTYVHPSHGADGCARMAEDAKIPTDRYELWRD